MPLSLAKNETILRKAGVWKKVLWISLAGCIAAPVLGFGGTVLGMLRTFDTIGISGSSNPEPLANDISLALMTSLGGRVLAIPSLIFLTISLCSLWQLKRAATAQSMPPHQ